MSDVTRILERIERGEAAAAEELLPLVYEELRRLAAVMMAREKPGQTLSATALVHEAYLRLVDREHQQQWDSRRHFFAAAAEAMRRILVETARRKGRLKHGREWKRVPLGDSSLAAPRSAPQHDILAVDEALERLASVEPVAAELVKLRFFAGLQHQEAASLLGLSRRAADHLWLVARAWLFQTLAEPDSR